MNDGGEARGGSPGRGKGRDGQDNALDATEPEAAPSLRGSYQMILAQLSMANSGNQGQAGPPSL